MRKSLFVSLLGLVLAVGSMFPFLKSDAAALSHLLRPLPIFENLGCR